VLVVEQIRMIGGAIRLGQARGAVSANRDKARGPIARLPAAHTVKALPRGDRHHCRLGLIGEFGKVARQLVGHPVHIWLNSGAPLD